MKKLYALCLLTLAAVVLDVLLFHSRSVGAVDVPTVRVDRIIWDTTRTKDSVPGYGHIVGFHCIQGVINPECFVASTTN